jgi:hypothetical protein
VSPKFVARCRWRRSDGTVSRDDSQVGILETVANRAAVGRRAEALVRDRMKFRVGRIVYVAFSRDETSYPRQSIPPGTSVFEEVNLDSGTTYTLSDVDNGLMTKFTVA